MRNRTSLALLLLTFLCSAGYWNLARALPIASDTSQLQASHYIRFFKPRYHRPKPVVVMLPDVQDTDDYNYVDGEIYPAVSVTNDQIVKTGGSNQNTAMNSVAQYKDHVSIDQQLPELNNETAGSLVKDIQALLQKYGVDVLSEQKGFTNAKYLGQIPPKRRYILPLINNININNINNFGKMTNIFSPLTENTSFKEVPKHNLNTTYSENKIENSATVLDEPMFSTAPSKSLDELAADMARRMLDEGSSYGNDTSHSESIVVITTGTPDYGNPTELNTSPKRHTKKTTTNIPFCLQTNKAALDDEDVILNKTAMMNRQIEVTTTEMAFEKKDVTDVSTTSTPNINDYVSVTEAFAFDGVTEKVLWSDRYTTSSSTLEHSSDVASTLDISSSSYITSTNPNDIEVDNYHMKLRDITTRVVGTDDIRTESYEQPSTLPDNDRNRVTMTTQTSFDESTVNIMDESFESVDTTTKSSTSVSLFSTSQDYQEFEEDRQPGTTHDVLYTIADDASSTLDQGFEDATTSDISSDYTTSTNLNDTEFQDDQTGRRALYIIADEVKDITTHVLETVDIHALSSELPSQQSFIEADRLAMTTHTVFDQSEVNSMDYSFDSDDITLRASSTVTTDSSFSTDKKDSDFEDVGQPGTTPEALYPIAVEISEQPIDTDMETSMQTSFDESGVNIMDDSFEIDDTANRSSSTVTSVSILPTEVAEDMKIYVRKTIETTTVVSYNNTAQDDMLNYVSVPPVKSDEVDEASFDTLFDFSNTTTTNYYADAFEESKDMHEYSDKPDHTETPAISTMLTTTQSYTTDMVTENFLKISDEKTDNLLILDMYPTAETAENINDDYFTTKDYTLEDTTIENETTGATPKEIVIEELDINQTGETTGSVTFDHGEGAYIVTSSDIQNENTTSQVTEAHIDETTTVFYSTDESESSEINSKSWKSPHTTNINDITSDDALLTTMASEEEVLTNDAIISSEQGSLIVDDATSTSDYITFSSYEPPIENEEVKPTHEQNEQITESDWTTTLDTGSTFSTVAIFADDSETVDFNAENKGTEEITIDASKVTIESLRLSEGITLSNTELVLDDEMMPTKNTFVTEHDRNGDVFSSTGATIANDMTTSPKNNLLDEGNLNTEPSHNTFEDDDVKHKNYTVEMTEYDELNVSTEYVGNKVESEEAGDVTHHYDKEHNTEYSIISTLSLEDSAIPLVSFTFKEELLSHDALANKKDKKEIEMDTSETNIENITEEQPIRFVIERITGIPEGIDRTTGSPETLSNSTLIHKLEKYSERDVHYATTFEPVAENHESNLEDHTIDNKYITNEALPIEDTSLYTTISDHNTTKRDNGLTETDIQKDVERKTLSFGKNTTKSPLEENTLKASLLQPGARRFLSPISNSSTEHAKDDAIKTIVKDNLNASGRIFDGKSGVDNNNKTSYKLSTHRTKPQKFHEDGLYLDPGQASKDYEMMEEENSSNTEKVDLILVNESEQSSSPRVRRTFITNYQSSTPQTFYLMNTQANIQNDQLKDIPQEKIHIETDQGEEKSYRDPLIQGQEKYYEHDQDLHQTRSDDHKMEKPSSPHRARYVDEKERQSFLSVMETPTVPRQNDSFENMAEVTTSRFI